MIPPEPPLCRDVNGLAPLFRQKLNAVMLRLTVDGWHPVYLETLRSDARQAWLYGFGRDYDDGRGIVTHAATAEKSWHRYGLAADLGNAGQEDGSAPAQFYADLGEACQKEGLTWGGSWHMQDKPHVQWYCDGMHVTPSDHAADLLRTEGVEAVWREVHAD